MSAFRKLLLAGVLTAAVLPEPLHAAIQPERGRRWALIVSSGGAGRSHALALAKALTTDFGFQREDGLVIHQDDADIGRILTAMQLLIASTRPNDELFVYFALPRKSEGSLTPGDFLFLPAGSRPNAPWTWMSGKSVFEWLGALPVAQALLVYPSCGEKSDEYLVRELAYGK